MDDSFNEIPLSSTSTTTFLAVVILPFGSLIWEFLMVLVANAMELLVSFIGEVNSAEFVLIMLTGVGESRSLEFVVKGSSVSEFIFCRRTSSESICPELWRSFWASLTETKSNFWSVSLQNVSFSSSHASVLILVLRLPSSKRSWKLNL